MLTLLCCCTGAWALELDGEGNYLIGSVQDWKDFAAIVNNGTNTAANARMTTDIDLGDDQTYISPTWHGEFSDKHYHGTFDGQGHTLTVHYNSSNLFHTPFSQTSGATIKNLHVAGTITSTSSEPSHMSGLVSNSAGHDVIENVWVSADITGGNNSWIECGAFVGCNNCGNTTIKDCLFTGSITTTGGNNGCFAGWVQSYSPSSVTTTNCLSTGTFNFTSGSVSRGTINNSYVKSYPNSIPADMQITAEQLADGTIAYKLQAGREGLVWGQRIGTDSEPVLTNDESYRVYKSKNGGYTNDPTQAYLGLQQDASGNYLIGSVMDWKEFAELINTTPTANAKMTADIDLGNDQTMIGSGSNNRMDGEGNVLFKGTFDGQGHTLTINYSNSETFVAPFRHILGATIKNIHVKGSITGSGKWLGGIVAAVFGQNVYSYLEKCYSSVSITSTNSPSDNTEHIGGIVAQHGWESNLSLNDCVFDGSLQRNSAKKTMSGLVGCYDGTIAISNSLHLGTLIDESNSPNSRIATLSYRWSTHGDLNPVNCYYKNALGEAQGTQATAEQLSNGTTASALQNGREEIIWVQDPVTNLPMLKLFANAVTLTDGDDLTALTTHAGKTCQVTYSRSFTEGKSSTVCLPFAFAKGTVGTFYTFTGISKSGSEYIADMTEHTGANLVPNTPYLFTPSATGSVDFSGTYEIPASITAGSTTSDDWTYLGTYETIEWTTAPTGIYGFSAQAVTEQGISQGEFVKVGAYVRVKPMRCYLKYKNGDADYAGARGMTRATDEELPETIKVRLIGANGELAGIGSMSTKTGEMTLDNGAWYSLDGRRIVGKPSTKGIYVRSTSGRFQGKNNGKKVIIK